MKVNVMPVIVVEPGTINKALVTGRKELEFKGQAESLRTKTLWDQPEYSEGFLRLEKLMVRL